MHSKQNNRMRKGPTVEAAGCAEEQNEMNVVGGREVSQEEEETTQRSSDLPTPGRPKGQGPHSAPCVPCVSGQLDSKEAIATATENGSYFLAVKLRLKADGGATMYVLMPGNRHINVRNRQRERDSRHRASTAMAFWNSTRRHSWRRRPSQYASDGRSAAQVRPRLWC